MRSSGIAALTALALLLGLPGPAAAGGKVKIKLGTVAPKGSPYYDLLARMGQEWKEASGGQVRLKIYPGGVAGYEGAMVRKLRTGRLHAATLTSIGVAEIDASLVTVQIPGLVREYDELDAALKAVEPLVRQRLAEKGFELLNIGDSGWVHFFTRTEVTSIDQMRQQKLFVAASDQASQEAWRAAGFTVANITSTDVLTSLQTGLIDGFVNPPLAALAYQWFGLAKYMADIRFAPLVGATLVSSKQWEKIDPALRPKLRAIAEKHMTQEQASIRQLNEDSIATMKEHGLKVHHVTGAEKAAYEKAALASHPVVRAKLVPADAFDLVITAAEQVRRSRSGQQK